MSSRDSLPRPSLRFGLLAIGVILLANPYFNLADPLPDAIGYLLLLAGLGELVWTHPATVALRKDLLILAGVSGARLAVFPLVASMPQEESPTMSLLCIFCFTAIEGYYGLRLLSDLWESASAVEIHAGIPVTARLPRKRTTAFFFGKLLCNFLPELCVLGVNEEGYIGSVTDNMSQRFLQLRNVLSVALFVVMLFLALPMLIGWLRYLGRLRRDVGAREALDAFVTSHPEPIARRRIRITSAATVILTLAVFLLWSIRIEKAVLLPPLLGAILARVATSLLGRITEAGRKESRLWGVFAVYSALNWVSQLLFVMKYGASGVSEGRGELWYGINLVLALIGAAASVLLLVRLARLLTRLVEEMGFASVDPVLARAAKAQAKRKYHLELLLKLLGLTALLPAACEVVELWLIFDRIGPTPEKEFPIWGIYMLIRLAYAVFGLAVLSRVKDAVKEKQSEET